MGRLLKQFCRIKSGKLRLADGRSFVGFEIVYWSFGLTSASLRKKTGFDERLSVAVSNVKDSLNGLDLCSHLQ